MDTDSGEFICPMCRQMANALLPVPPVAPTLPATVFPKDPAEKVAMVAQGIKVILSEGVALLVRKCRKLQL